MSGATPKSVRAELKRRGLPYTIHKDGGCWYVWGPGCESWFTTSLSTYRFDGATSGFWVDWIEDMAKEEEERQCGE
jgi:hypothetical protein